jgi:ATP-dependent DNA helicase RecG
MGIRQQECLSTVPCTGLSGVGPRLAEKLLKLGVQSVQDLLFHLPSRYQDRTTVVPMNRAQPNEHVLVEGVVASARVVYGRRMSLSVLLHDDRGHISLRFFHFNKSMRANLSKEGQRLRCFGEVRFGSKGLEMVHPEFEVVEEGAILPLPDRLTPIYPVTEGVGQVTIRRLIGQALACLKGGGAVYECLPEAMRAEYHLPPLTEALPFVHNPPCGSDVNALMAGEHPMLQCLVFEELLAHQLCMVQVRQQLRRHKAQPLDGGKVLRDQLTGRLGFELTQAQQRVIIDIDQDLQQAMPMMRLVQGDVGCGKTVVAAMAMCRAIAMGHQAVLMAPTEVLAEQHYRTFQAWFSDMGICVAWLGGKLPAKVRREMLQVIASGEALVVIGTHALFQAGVVFHDLSLVVIDEQHRFGVAQRYALCQKGAEEGRVPHQLIMTATPIPRTMAMTAYAELDYSVIDALPAGRQPIQTVVLANNRREQVVERVLASCLEGGQAYWVCTLIEESEALQAQAAEGTAEMLSACLPGIAVGLVHGRMSAEDKWQVKARFKSGELGLLVASTVIEVGVDVANANLMVIENAERLGLSQLHQLRGRVGRGNQASYCVLMYQGPLTHRGRERLDVLRRSSDGFVIAEKDLALRGAGEVLGTRQTGVAQYRVADVLRDQAMLPQVQKAARALMASHPDRVDGLIRRWLGEKGAYSGV